ncbi:hypothetical protein [Winogradskyella sp.]|jgi:hypothetical protein|uniref:hypothetical protein n=1 Tax=Winogradskyella sp. TaxID=1883156 RepID=UPI0025CCCF43|nr:hypothetical protein [Winogradskyella sp.]MCT4630036.1 ABC transporter permease [Winogradskyella sp.]
MKNFIHKTNQYLLERYPTIWNTRLVWMLLTAFILHLVFFTFGYITLSNPEILQNRYVRTIFFENGTVFLTSIISILLLVLWLIYMFKNNAFKNFYPVKSIKLFGQFVCYLLIIFSCSSFFLSYSYGIKTYISITYSDSQVSKEIEIANDVAMFFSENVSDYTINKRRYPKPFYELYCERTNDFIDFDKPYLEFEGKSFQFYSLTTKEVPYEDRYTYINKTSAIENDSVYKKYVFSIAKDSTSVLYFKDSVVNVQPYVKTEVPSYYNASYTFFVSRNDTLNNIYHNYDNWNYNEVDYDYNSRPQFSLRHKLRNKRNYELLQRGDKTEIKTLLKEFLTYSKYYKIPHNIDTQQWLDLVYHPKNFEVKNFIRTQPKTLYENNAVTTELTRYEKFYLERETDFFYDNNALHSVFENIEDIKASNPLMESIHFFMWFTFLLASLIFMFRVTGLKPLLFSIITVGVLILFISLTAALLFYLNKGNSEDNIIYFLLYFTLFISSVIIAIPIFFAERIKKIIVAICVNISLIGFSLYLFLIISIISLHQKDACREHPDYYKDGFECYTLLEILEINWSYIFFIVGILFLLFYTKIIKKWKSLPEG